MYCVLCKLENIQDEIKVIVVTKSCRALSLTVYVNNKTQTITEFDFKKLQSWRFEKRKTRFQSSIYYRRTAVDALLFVCECVCVCVCHILLAYSLLHS